MNEKCKITKCIVAVAGLGTRFLPATKVQPKEMLTVVDKPVIQYIAEEAVASGISDIILVTSQNKRALEDHFDHSFELEAHLEDKGKMECLAEVKQISEMANFIYIRQKGPYGNGTPVLNSRYLVGNEPFAVMFGDDIVVSSVPRLKQLIEVYEKYKGPVIAVAKVPNDKVSSYGVIDGTELEKGVYRVSSIIEKPSPENALSNLAVCGCYIFTPDIFEILENTVVGKNNELWLTDAILKLAAQKPFYACVVEGEYYDTGSKFGWLKANIDLALQDSELQDTLKDYLRSL